MPVIELSQTVLATQEEAYTLLCQPALYSQLFPGVYSIALLEEYPQGARTAWIIDVDGLKFSWEQVEEYHRQDKTLSFKQIQGDMLKFEGIWSISQLAESTKVSIYLDFDPGIPMLTGLFHFILMKKVRDTLQELLQGLKEYAEHRPVKLEQSCFIAQPHEPGLQERQL